MSSLYFICVYTKTTPFSNCLDWPKCSDSASAVKSSRSRQSLSHIEYYMVWSTFKAFGISIIMVGGKPSYRSARLLFPTVMLVLTQLSGAERVL